MKRDMSFNLKALLLAGNTEVVLKKQGNIK